MFCSDENIYGRLNGEERKKKKLSGAAGAATSHFWHNPKLCKLGPGTT